MDRSPISQRNDPKRSPSKLRHETPVTYLPVCLDFCSHWIPNYFYTPNQALSKAASAAPHHESTVWFHPESGVKVAALRA